MNKIFECIVGSHAYGTNIETSDIDIKGVYLQPNRDILGLKYCEQTNVNKDTTYYEVRRFVELLSSANPTVLEMLFVDRKFIKVNSPVFQILVNRKYDFLTKACLNSFGGYAVSQIKKARGLDKKINWEKSKTIRKEPIDFCYVPVDSKSIPVKDFLDEGSLKAEYCGLQGIDHMPGCYLIYYDYAAHFGKDSNTPEIYSPLNYKGFGFEDSNALRLSSIPKDQNGLHIGMIYYNQDAYSMHCKDYNQYQEWLKNRNADRYVKTNNEHIDGKNMMHCLRLIECAEEIGLTGNLTVLRPNSDFLVSIRKGKVNLEELLTIAEEKIKGLDQIYENSNLPEALSLEEKHRLILKIREYV